jgi:hypothetical protein
VDIEFHYYLTGIIAHRAGFGKNKILCDLPSGLSLRVEDSVSVVRK